MSAINFFSHPDHLPTQVADNQYGPMAETATTPSNANNPQNLYRVASLFSGSASGANPNPSAFAVMTGELFIFQTANSAVHADNSTRVNLVLRPPASFLGNGLPRIKYFIYRGILKSEFFAGANIAAAAVTNNAIVAEVHQIDTDNGNTDEATKFVDNFAAVSGVADGTALDTFFLNGSYHGHHVEQGELIGRFDGDGAFKYGFEVVMEDYDGAITVGEARQDDHIIDASTGTNAEKELKRLAILQYLDPAALFGMYARNHFGKVDANKTGENPIQGSKLIDRVLSKFATKETVYLDLRDADDLPIDFVAEAYADNNNSQIRITKNKAATAAAVAYRNTHQWPIHIVKGFTNVTNSKRWRYYTLRVSLPKGDVAATTPLIYNPFANFTQYWPLFDVETMHSMPGLTGSWTNDIKLAFVASDNGAHAVASSYARLRYTQAEDEAYLTEQLAEFSPWYHEASSTKRQLRLGWLPSAGLVTKTVDGQPSKTATFGGGGFYAAFAEVGYEGRQGRGVDACGETAFGYRGQSCIQLENKSDAENDAIPRTAVRGLLELSGQRSTANSLYEALHEWSRYDRDRLDAHFYGRNNKGVLTSACVKLTGTVNTVEVRVNEPQVFRGFKEWSPADPLYSAAYATSEKATLDTLVNNATKFSDQGRQRKFLVIDVGSVTKLTADADSRPYFRASFKVRGLKYNTTDSKYEWKEEALGLSFYSLDARNYVTHAYAEKMRTLGGHTLWENKIVPDISADPVYSDATKFEQAISIAGNPPTTKTFPALLTDVLTAAKNVNERLVLGEIRDYLYERDINFLSYELAFRLPFFTESPTEDPYENVTIGGVSVPNNPYIDQFFTPAMDNPPFYLAWADLQKWLNWQYELDGADAITETTYAAIGTKLEAKVPAAKPIDARAVINTKERIIRDFEVNAVATDTWEVILKKIHPKGWFLQANLLRANQLSPGLEQLSRSGLTASTAALPKHDSALYHAVNVIRETEFNTHQVAAYKARAFNWENPKSYFNRHGKYPHLPLGAGESVTLNSYDLGHLEAAGVISAAAKATLEALPLADFGYQEITNGAYTINGVATTLNGKYLFKKANDANFYIYDMSYSGGFASGITVGLGYDIGANTGYAEFLDYIDVASFSGIKEDVINAALGEKAVEAMKVFYPFKAPVWDTIVLDYSTTIVKTVPFMEKEYLSGSFNLMFKARQVWKSGWIRNNKYYYQGGGLRINNELELAYLATHAYNTGVWRADLGSGTPSRVLYAKRMLHAFNTHDIRFLRRANTNSRIAHRVTGVRPMLDRAAGIEHYRK